MRACYFERARATTPAPPNTDALKRVFGQLGLLMQYANLAMTPRERPAAPMASDAVTAWEEALRELGRSHEQEGELPGEVINDVVLRLMEEEAHPMTSVIGYAA